VVITIALPDAEPLHRSPVRPADRNGQAIPTHQTTSPKAILMAKSEIRTIQVW
jgi:arginine/lysine/ornithine decarboxylase